MSGRTGNAVFWAGTAAWVAALVAVEVGAHRRVYDDLAVVGRVDAGVAAGRLDLERHHCGACHSVLGTGPRYAPDLTRASRRIGEWAIHARLAGGECAGGRRNMPHKPLAAEEIDRMVAYLGWVARVDARERPREYPPDRVAAALRRAAPRPHPGAALVADHGCLDCHGLGERGGDRAPRFEAIAARSDAASVGAYLADPVRSAPGSSMPAFAKVPQAERRAMGEFVASLTR